MRADAGQINEWSPHRANGKGSVHPWRTRAMDATINPQEKNQRGKRCRPSMRSELIRAVAKLESAAAALDRAFAAGEDGLRAPIAITRGETLTAMDHARTVLRKAA